MTEFIVPSNIAKLELLAKDIYEYRTGPYSEEPEREPCARDYGIDFLNLFLEIQTLFSMVNDLNTTDMDGCGPVPETVH